MLNQQFRQVLRRLSRAPLFTAVTLLTLAVGIGANTVIFSVVEGVLLKPLPYSHPEQLIGVWHSAPGIGIKELNMSSSIYFVDREQNTTLQEIGAYDGDSLSVTGAGGAGARSRTGCDRRDLTNFGSGSCRGTSLHASG